MTQGGQQASWQQLAGVLERVSDAVVALDRDWRYTYVNSQAAALFGRTPEQLLGKHIWTEFPEGVGQPFHLAYERAMAEQKPIELEDYYAPWDRWFENRIFPSPDGLSIFFHEITDRKRAELLIGCQMAVLERVARAAPLGDCLDALARGVEERAHGMRCSILLLDGDGVHMRHGAGPSLPPEYNRALDGLAIGPEAGTCGTAAYTGQPVVTEDIGTDPRWAAYRHLAVPHGLRACWSTPILDERQKVSGTFALYYTQPGKPPPAHRQVIDMATNAARVAIGAERARAALAESRARYQDLYENSPDMLLSVDARTRRILECNDTLARVSGHLKSELIGRDVLELYDPALGDRVRQVFQQFVATGEVHDAELRIRRKDGTVLDVSLNATAVRGSDGTILHSRSDLRDISLQKQAQDALRQLSSRLLQLQDEERRRIARELHDTTVQNLAALSMNLSLLEPSGDERGRQLVETCRALVERSAQELRTLSYLLHPPLLEDFGLARAIEEYVEGFSRRSGIAVTLDVPASWVRLGREVELALFRVLQECLSNVLRHSGSKTASVRLSRAAGRAELEVRDRGRGLPPSELPGSGKGVLVLGVGISGMRERLLQLGGGLDVASDSQGTRVTASVPVSEEPP